MADPTDADLTSGRPDRVNEVRDVSEVSGLKRNVTVIWNAITLQCMGSSHRNTSLHLIPYLASESRTPTPAGPPCRSHNGVIGIPYDGAVRRMWLRVDRFPHGGPTVRFHMV
jgi:hypothetical protein